jgi:hypothetical protein
MTVTVAYRTAAKFSANHQEASRQMAMGLDEVAAMLVCQGDNYEQRGDNEGTGGSPDLDGKGTG